MNPWFPEIVAWKVQEFPRTWWWEIPRECDDELLARRQLGEAVSALTHHPGSATFHAARPSATVRVHEPREPDRPTIQENVMKRLAFVAAVLAVTACSKSEEANKDTTTPAMAPAPAPATADTGMKMDTTHKMDTTMKKDTSKMAGKKKP
jgi:hypothetical protein